MKPQGPRIVHPYLFAIFPALSIVADHIRFLRINQTIVALALVTLLLTGLCLLLLQRLGVSRLRAALIVTLALLLFFSYGHVYTLLSETFPSLALRHRHLSLIWVLVAVLLAYFAWRVAVRLPLITSFLNIVGVSLVLLSAGQIVSYEIRTRNAWQPAGLTNLPAGSSDPAPDIYYIILDTYASTSTLRDHYGFDNGEFIDFLQERGFFIAQDSFSNYAVTTLSLASSLNMDYLQNLYPDLAAQPADLAYEIPKQMIEHNQVMTLLQSMGYRFIFLGSGKGISQENRFADEDIRCSMIDETVGRIIQSTLIWPVADQLEWMARDDRRQRLCAFETVAGLAAVPGPKFVFAHVLAPHAPFLFDAQGNPVREQRGGPEETKAHYINQMIFINGKVEEMVGRLLAESAVEPIIILQGDTGPPYGFEPGDVLNSPTTAIYQQNMRILNAYHLPGQHTAELRSDLSPVNTFRLIFNLYFAAGLPLLPDESYFSTGNRPYEFINVTEQVR